jgi:hypothetical protein
MPAFVITHFLCTRTQGHSCTVASQPCTLYCKHYNHAMVFGAGHAGHPPCLIYSKPAILGEGADGNAVRSYPNEAFSKRAKSMADQHLHIPQHPKMLLVRQWSALSATTVMSRKSGHVANENTDLSYGQPHLVAVRATQPAMTVSTD